MAKLKLELNEELIDRTYELAKKGHTKKYIAMGLGIHEETFWRWQKKSRIAEKKSPDSRSDKDNLFVRFYTAYKKGYFEWCDKMMQKVDDVQDWQAAMTRLERRDYRTFARKQGIDIEDLEVKVRKEFGDEAADKILDVLEEADEKLDEV